MKRNIMNEEWMKAGMAGRTPAARCGQGERGSGAPLKSLNVYDLNKLSTPARCELNKD